MSCITTEEGGDAVPAILPGFSFCPSDKDLVGYYLKMKIEGNDSIFRRIIPEIDLYKLEPPNIPAFFKEPDSPHHDREWIFFTRPDRKYTNSNRCNRATEKGFYKITGKERDIQAQQSEAVIGKKRTLTFYQGRMPGAKRTDWGLHELSLCKTEPETGPNPHQQRDFVVCRLSLRDKSANCKSGNKRLKDDLIGDELTDSSNGSFGASNSGADQAASTDNVINEISTKKRKFETIGILCDDDESFSDFDSPAANKRLQEFCAELGKVLDSPPPAQPTPQPPGIGDNNSYPAHKNELSTNGHNEPVSDIANSVQDLPTDETSSEVYNHSTDYRKEPISNTTYDHLKGAADERVSEAYFLPEDILQSLFHPFDPQDCTLMSPMTGEQGDVVHCQ